MQEDFEQMERKVLRALERAGFEVRKARPNQPGFDLVATKANQRIAVQVKNHRAPTNVKALQRTFDYICSPEASGFAYALLVTASSFATPALAWYSEVGNLRLKLATFDGEQLHWLPDPTDATTEPQPSSEQTFVGVFTAKGGVGKTTCAAHLAGAMTLCDYKVALIDLDPQYNLKNLLGDSVPIARRSGDTSPLRIFTLDEWNGWSSRAEFNVVVCDCSPRFEANPESLIRRFNYCIIPTTLNPLGLNTGGLVVKESYQKIRGANKSVSIFAFINNYVEGHTRLASALYEAYTRTFKDLMACDKHFEVIDPEEAAIRQSDLLFYWGKHVYLRQEKCLAFQAVGGRCKPKEDFLNLLSYLEHRTPLREAR